MTVGYILTEQVEHVSEAVKKNTGSANVCKYVAQSNYPISYWIFPKYTNNQAICHLLEWAAPIFIFILFHG